MLGSIPSGMERMERMKRQPPEVDGERRGEKGKKRDLERLVVLTGGGRDCFFLLQSTEHMCCVYLYVE